MHSSHRASMSVGNATKASNKESSERMRLLIISDTHGQHERIAQVIRQVGAHDLMIHAGDLAEDIVDAYPKALTVVGNCDFHDIAEVEHDFEVLGLKGLLTHGHTLQVKTSPLPLLYRAAEKDADLVIFGHTHTPTLVVEDGRILMNPGSLSYSRGYTVCTYAIVDLTKESGATQAEFSFYTINGDRIPAFDLTHRFEKVQ